MAKKSYDLKFTRVMNLPFLLFGNERGSHEVFRSRANPLAELIIKRGDASSGVRYYFAVCLAPPLFRNEVIASPYIWESSS